MFSSVPFNFRASNLFSFAPFFQTAALGDIIVFQISYSCTMEADPFSPLHIILYSFRMFLRPSETLNEAAGVLNW